MDTPAPLPLPGWRVAAAGFALLLIAGFASGLVPFGIPGQFTWPYLPLSVFPAMGWPFIVIIIIAALVLPRAGRLAPRPFVLLLFVLAAALNLSAFLLHYQKTFINDVPGQLRHFAANHHDNSYLNDAWRIASLPAFILHYPEVMPRLYLPHNPHQPPLKIVAHYLLLKLLGGYLYVPLAFILLNSTLPALVWLLTGNRTCAAAAVLLPQAVIFAVTPDVTLAGLVLLLLTATERGRWWQQALLLLVIQFWSFAFFPIAAGWLLYTLAARRPARAAAAAVAAVILVNLPLTALGVDYLAMFRVMQGFFTNHISRQFVISYPAALLYVPGEYLIFSFLPLLFVLRQFDRRRLAVALLLAAALALSGATRFETPRTWLFVTAFAFAALRDWHIPARWFTAALLLAGAQIVLFKFCLAFYSY